ncbi:MurR/RpiR family transcriptional regulator [Photobacterium rosenbergii]|uniref:MurR/RpiR family transcriptional regulator n=1 Tax=Photobacterium rosenbergii TaxID=294936 RepID=UPI001C99A650|nr:MurR/RpiR family transcriptional regulator [Photobacterium rosenbergii]MBY5944549.1 MurR/RpiR family transcriptional regulator [Photobacterium rosenbergii]
MNDRQISYQVKFRGAIQQLTTGIESKLTKSEVKVIDYYLANADHAGHSGKDIANAIQVHPSTLVRLAQKLGFRGHPELKQYLIKFANQSADASERHQHTLSQMEGSVLQSTINQEIEHLRLIDSAVSQPLLDEACQLILSANKVFINGQDNTEGFAEHFSRRLNRSGIDAETVSLGRSKLAECLTASQPEDVLVLIFNNTMNEMTEKLIKIARNLQLQVIGISDLSSLSVPQDVLLLRVYRGETKETKSVSPPLVITNAIVRNLTVLAEERVMQGLRRFEMIRALED